MEETFIRGFLAALAAGLVTGVGGMGIFLKKHYLKSEINQMLNIAAGVMLAASFFSLLEPAMEAIVHSGDAVYISSLKYVATVFAGVVLVWVLNMMIPHEHNSIGHHGPHFDITKAWLFIIAITLHKLPEGLAVGVAYSAEDMMKPLSLAIGIAAHNIPEGLTIAISLVAAGSSRIKAVVVSGLIGLVQPLGALVGLGLMNFGYGFIPYGMALAGGTLLFVIINEILPETYGYKDTNKSAAAVFVGFILMTYVTMVFKD